MNIKHVEILATVKEIFDDLGVTFWLDDGTLLGAVRENKFIAWDNDVDLGVYFRDLNKIAPNKNKFKERNLQLTVRLTYGTMFIHQNGSGVSVKLFRVSQDKAWALFPSPETKTQKLFGWVLSAFTKETFGESRYTSRKRKIVNCVPLKLRNLIANVLEHVMKQRSYLKFWVIPNHFFSQLSTIKFYGSQFHIPSKVEEYLKFRYGDSWKTSNPDWVWFRDDGATKTIQT